MLTEVDFAPDSEVAEILQNVRTVLSTMIYSVPLERDLGLTGEHVDKPLPVAKVMQQVAIVDAIEKYEPRAKVKSIEFENNIDDAMRGNLTPRVVVLIGEDKEDL